MNIKPQLLLLLVSELNEYLTFVSVLKYSVQNQNRRGKSLFVLKFQSVVHHEGKSRQNFEGRWTWCLQHIYYFRSVNLLHSQEEQKELQRRVAYTHQLSYTVQDQLPRNGASHSGPFNTSLQSRQPPIGMSIGQFALGNFPIENFSDDSRYQLTIKATQDNELLLVALDNRTDTRSIPCNCYEDE